MPRIEFVSSSGKVAQSYDAMGFEHRGKGIFVAERLRTETYGANGQVTYRGSYTITDVQLVNQPIPDDDFVVRLPIGTNVLDARDPNKSKTFAITDSVLSTELLDVADRD